MLTKKENLLETIRGGHPDRYVKQFEAFHLLMGFFEQCHFLCEITNILTYFYTDPECIHDLIAYLLDWEMEFADEYCTKTRPDAILHHDDWGTQISSFISPEMFEEFFLEPYKQLYGFYKSRNVLIVLIVHHADCYCANLVPHMIEMGVDIWQVVLSTNDIPKLLRKYGGQISIMGGIDNGLVDRVDWTPEKIFEVTRKVCQEGGTDYFILTTTVGRNTSAYPGVYEAVGDAVEQVSREMWTQNGAEDL